MCSAAAGGGEEEEEEEEGKRRRRGESPPTVYKISIGTRNMSLTLTGESNLQESTWSFFVSTLTVQKQKF